MIRNLLIAAFFTLAATLASAQQQDNYQGLWWGGQAEAGWNLTLSHQGDTLFAIWATYDELGKPTWLSMTATQLGPASFSGTLYRTTGPRFGTVPFNPSRVTMVDVGVATLDFSGPNEGRFAYSVEGVSRVKSITRFAWGAANQTSCVWNSLKDLAVADNFQDLWWSDPAGSEPGWAVSIASFGQSPYYGQTLVTTWFTYDLEGSPIWYFGAARSIYGEYYGSLFRTTGPSFLAPTFDPAAVTSVPVGDIEFEYTDGNHMYMYTAVGSVGQSQKITRYVFRGSGTTCGY